MFEIRKKRVGVLKDLKLSELSPQKLNSYFLYFDSLLLLPYRTAPCKIEELLRKNGLTIDWECLENKALNYRQQFVAKYESDCKSDPCYSPYKKSYVARSLLVNSEKYSVELNLRDKVRGSLCSYQSEEKINIYTKYYMDQILTLDDFQYFLIDDLDSDSTLNYYYEGTSVSALILSLNELTVPELPLDEFVSFRNENIEKFHSFAHLLHKLCLQYDSPQIIFEEIRELYHVYQVNAEKASKSSSNVAFEIFAQAMTDICDGKPMAVLANLVKGLKKEELRFTTSEHEFRKLPDIVLRFFMISARLLSSMEIRKQSVFWTWKL